MQNIYIQLFDEFHKDYMLLIITALILLLY